jgi:hypothetical protein
LSNSFGYLDSISQPGVKGFGTVYPGQVAVPAGVALCCNPGDVLTHNRPAWAMDGSFMVFRYLEQLVPEFDDFLIKHPIVSDWYTRREGSELQGYVLPTRLILDSHPIHFIVRGCLEDGNQVSWCRLAGF